MSDPNIEALVAKYHELSDYRDREQTAFDTRMKPYADGANVIKAMLLTELTGRVCRISRRPPARRTSPRP